MSQIRDIKSRIESVKKTKKITQAMKMVSAAKFKRAVKRRDQTLSYLNHLDSIYNRVKLYAHDSKYAQQHDTEKVACIIITSDRGLCGGFNSSILKYTLPFLNDLKGTPDLYLIGKKGAQFFQNKGFNIISKDPSFGGQFTNDDILPYFQSIINDYLEGNYSKVYLIFNSFISAIQNVPKAELLLPIANTSGSESIEPIDIILDPSEGKVLEEVTREKLLFAFLESLIDSHAAEEGARMAAMDSATDNAGEMINDLTLLYNRTRQAQITKELSEIVAGAEALVS